MEANAYYEKQKFNNIFFLSSLIILLPLFVMFLYGIIQQIYFGIPFGDHPVSSTTFIVIFILFIFLSFSISIGFKLTTLILKIDEESIAYCWKPFRNEFKLVKFADILSIEIIKFNFVGYGYRISKKYGEMHVANGNKGICIILKSSKKMVIGTNNITAIKKALIKYAPPEKLNMVA